MMPPLRSFDDVDRRERGRKKTDDLRAMTTLGPRTLVTSLYSIQILPIFRQTEVIFRQAKFAVHCHANLFSLYLVSSWIYT